MQKDTMIQFRVSDHIKKKFIEVAKSKGMSISDYARHLIAIETIKYEEAKNDKN